MERPKLLQDGTSNAAGDELGIRQGRNVRLYMENMHTYIGYFLAILGILLTIYFGLPVKRKRMLAKQFVEELNSGQIGTTFGKLINIKKIIKKNFPTYQDYIVVQYGSSICQTDFNDYDFIVLLIGYSNENTHQIVQVGNNSDIYIQDFQKVDIVFRDYSSFLFALVSGMPYENSVIMNSRYVEGNKGYYLWLHRIAMNILIDRDFLLRRFDTDKLPMEVNAWKKAKMSKGNTDKDTYDKIRAAYYLLCSLIQRQAISKLSEITYHEEVSSIAFANNLRGFIRNKQELDVFNAIVSALKRENVPRIDYTFLSRVDDLIKKLSSYIES